MASGLKMNVAIQMFDSQSNANIRRQAVRTIQYLEQDEHSFIFNANSIVGDGTTAQVSAMLTGILLIKILFLNHMKFYHS